VNRMLDLAQVDPAHDRPTAPHDLPYPASRRGVALEDRPAGQPTGRRR
jgi:hypothetical protein